MTARARAIVEVAGDPRDALAPAVLRHLGGESLSAWLCERRWYSAKGAQPRAVRVAGAVRLPWGDGACIALLEVDLPDGSTLRFQLPLVVSGDASADDVAEVRAGVTRAYLADATQDARFRRALGQALVEGFRAEEEGLVFVAGPLAGVAMPTLGPGSVGSAEQSNTSVRYGAAAICKLFRRLEPGENPDVEMTRFLTAGARFAGTPALLATARLELHGEAMTAAMLQQLVPDAVDGWSFALDHGRAYFADHGGVAPPNAFVPEARKLGRLTGEMHAALSRGTDAFATHVVDDEELARWARAARDSVERGLALLEARRATGFAGISDAEVASVLSGRDAFLGYAQRASDAVRGHAGVSMRHHGDYHLGQVLRDGEGRYHVIDFEGEPTRPLAERRHPHSPLRDVASMLRSFTYASGVLERDHPDDADADTRGRHRIRAELWERAARDAFVESYREAVPAQIMPDAPERVAALLALFETEKVFYELAYEVNNRPGWAWIPLRGILRLPAR